MVVVIILFLYFYHREVWPEGDVFGSADVEPEEELELLKQILIANLPSECLCGAVGSTRVQDST